MQIIFKSTVLLKNKRQAIQFFSLYNDIFIKVLWCSFFLRFSFFADTLCNTNIQVIASLVLHFNSFFLFFQSNFLAAYKLKVPVSGDFCNHCNSRSLFMFLNVQYGYFPAIYFLICNFFSLILLNLSKILSYTWGLIMI